MGPRGGPDMAWPARTMVRMTPPASGFLRARVARFSFDMTRDSRPQFTSGQQQEQRLWAPPSWVRGQGSSRQVKPTKKQRCFGPSTLQLVKQGESHEGKHLLTRHLKIGEGPEWLRYRHSACRAHRRCLGQLNRKRRRRRRTLMPAQHCGHGGFDR